MIIVGTRPEIIKMSPLIREIQNKAIEFVLVHTGQHYDYEMSLTFFDSLKLPKININLDVRESSEALQISEMISKLESIILKEKPLNALQK